MSSAQESFDDDCPIPKVEVRNVWEGHHHGRGLDYYPDAAAMNDMIINVLIEANRGSVQFFEQVGTAPPDVDFHLSVEGSVAEEAGTSGETTIATTITLVDTKGRVVREPVQVSYTYAQRGDAELAARLAGPMNPLVFFIRSHQMRIREAENSAIYARARIDPEQTEAELGEEVALQVALTDCGPEPYPLADRELVFEHHGVGTLDPLTVVTGGEGRAEVVFRSESAGSARAIPVWRYENTSGIPTAAEANSADINISAAWDLTAEVIAAGDMTTEGAWRGNFRVIDENRIDGRGVLRTTVTGSCVSGWSDSPFRITGQLVDETLHVLLTDFGENEPEIEMQETLECAVRTLTELPAFMAGLGSLIERALQSEPCPLRVPSGQEVSEQECGGVVFAVRRQ